MGWTWQRADEDGEFEAYEDDIVDKLERALKKGARRINVSTTEYVDLSNINDMVERSKADDEEVGKVRRVELVADAAPAKKPKKAKAKKRAAPKTKKAVPRPKNYVHFPGAAYEYFELSEFAFSIELGDDKSARFRFAFDTAEVKQTKRAKNDDEDDEDEDEDDWTSRAVWDNYGPGVNSDWDFGELIYRTKSGKLQLEGKTLTFRDADQDEGFNVHCCDHQETRENKITFVSRHGNTFELEWHGVVQMDGSEDRRYPFSIRTDAASFEGVTDGGQSVLAWFGDAALFRSDGQGKWLWND